MIKAARPHNPERIKKRFRHFLVALLRYILIICLCYLILAPILQNITVSFTDPRDLSFPSSVWIPARFSVENWHVSLLVLRYGESLPYTFFNTLALAALQVVNAMLAGYAFARLKFPLRGMFFAIVLFTIIVPPQVFMFPQYLYFREFDIFGLIRLFTGKPLNLLNKPAALYVLAATGMGLKSGLYIYIFRQAFRGLPKELEEAAYIDGAGFMRTFVSIVLPAAGAGILTVTVLSFVWNWNDSYYTNLFDSLNLKNLMLAFNRATGSINEAIGGVYSKVPVGYAVMPTSPVYQSAINKTATLLVFLPLVFLYLLVQRKFVQGIERAGIVG